MVLVSTHIECLAVYNKSMGYTFLSKHQEYGLVMSKIKTCANT